MLLLLPILTTLMALAAAKGDGKSGKVKGQKDKVKSTSFKVTSQVTLEVEVKNYNGQGDDINGEVTIGLFGETAPATTLNFKGLCEGFKRPTYQDKVGFRNTYCHRVVKDMLIQCGDVFNLEGRGGTSIYGDSFNDENFDVSHTSGGIVSMANRGKNSNGSQFFFTLGSSRFLDKKHVAFGKVLKGFQYVALINKIGAGEVHGFPKRPVRIVECSVNKDAKELTLSEEDMKTDDLEGTVVY